MAKFLYSHNVTVLYIGLFLQPTLMHNSISTCMSHYYPRHVSGLDMPILRRSNCTNTASGILALLSGCTLHRLRADSSWGWACQGPKHVEDSNVTYMLLLNCALKLVEEIILYYDARSKKHQSPLYVSSSIVLILRRSNCMYTAYGIVTLYEWSWCCAVHWLRENSLSTRVLYDHHDHS